ncbi:MAG TPA: cation:proton antiporter [Chitinophagales bacterium]|nr:cation:proton antiporter [Chitinophagales bacterium]HMZ88482.1 cation:proton antiporter [Chitinophagales bacterium]HNE46929.1 cation:proton antiporter [Chitinophagales bacterium]HNI55083.1 cation:proton antiporter [Chitinophagales bacterium]HNJ89899.1 cation:proton antiporter [Chitinophagales bacterium]
MQGWSLLMDLSTPFKEPVIIFSIVLAIILLSPILLKTLRIPSIVVMIIAGVIIGPHGFQLLERDGAIVLFGTVGLLYIMFLAGLEIDLHGFRKNISRSVSFGLFTFIIPFIIGFAVCRMILHLDMIPALITASMFSTQTLVAYPIVSRLGITRSAPVAITVGGTIITDTLVLLLFSVVTNFAMDKSDSFFWLRLAISVIAFAAIVLYIYPIFAKWFFSKLENEGGSQFIFVLTLVFIAAFLSQLAGLEHIIGAFLAGISLTRLIPHSSTLKNRIVFVGNNIFIPFFLINVGMIIDLHVLIENGGALTVAAILVTVALSTKYIAAWITQKTFGLTRNEGSLIFGLSTAHAAATLAIILVGFDLGLLDEKILNGTIIVILVSCLVSSFVTENAGRKYVLLTANKVDTDPEVMERILVPVGNPDSAEKLLDLAMMIRNPGSKEPIYPLAVVEDGPQAREQLIRARRNLQLAAEHVSSSETKVQVLTRVDVSIAGGISGAVKELGITEVVLGWHSRVSTSDRLFGSIIQQVIKSTDQMLWIGRLSQPLNTIDRIAILMPPNAEFESGFFRWLEGVKQLSQQTGARCMFWGERKTLEIVDAVNNAKFRLIAEYSEFTDWDDLESLQSIVKTGDLLVVVSARQKSVSHFSALDQVPGRMHTIFGDKSFILLYPYQSEFRSGDMNFEYSVLTPSAFKENIARINQIGKIVYKAFTPGKEKK